MYLNLDKEIESYLLNCDKFIIGVSGGADSIFLLHQLVSLGFKNKIIVAHVNHGFREESKVEYKFVENLCLELGVIFEGVNLDVPGFMKEHNLSSLESSARDLRYNFYSEILNKYSSNYLLLGHHGDDLIEGVLMRLVSGASGRGLISMTKVNDISYDFTVLRPLLDYSKSCIYKFSSELGYTWFEDESNLDNSITRNRYRNLIVPLLREENSNLLGNISRFSELKNEEEHYFDNVIKDIYNKIVEKNYLGFYEINRNEFLKLDIVLKRRIICFILKSDFNCEYLSHNILDVFLEKINAVSNTNAQKLVNGVCVVNSSHNNNIYLVIETYFDNIFSYLKADSFDFKRFDLISVDKNLIVKNKKIYKYLKELKIANAFRNYILYDKVCDCYYSLLGDNLFS